MQHHKNRLMRHEVVIYLAGDSGDGVQLMGSKVTESSAIAGNDIQTFADFPAEIRAPMGTLSGVSGFQLRFSAQTIETVGDQVDVLVAMNPAALKAAIHTLKPGGILWVDENKWTPKDWQKAGYTEDPINESLKSHYRLFCLPITDLSVKAVESLALGRVQARKTKNFFVLGVLYYLFDRPLDPTISWIQKKFQKDPSMLEANSRALQAGYNYAITVELFEEVYTIPKADFLAGTYRQVTGNQGVALACAVVASQSPYGLLMAGYPITPASDILHQLARYRSYGIRTFQAEDEIAAMGAAIGGAYGGTPSLTCTSGPGLDLKSEGLGLAVMTELPVVVVNVQRAGPSTGMPTKTEQSDLNLALYGRHGECPLPVLAASTPSDCFEVVIEAFRIAQSIMSPVIVLSDAYLANASEPWQIPNMADLPKIQPHYHKNPNQKLPYQRTESGGRPWIIPGTPELMHRIGGLEKQAETGNISSDPLNHQRMVKERAQKVMNLQNTPYHTDWWGEECGDILLISWGSTFGAVRTAAKQLKALGVEVSHIHVRLLNPIPHRVKEALKRFSTPLVCELNTGQFKRHLQSLVKIPLEGIHQVTGKPFQVGDIVQKVQEYVKQAIV